MLCLGRVLSLNGGLGFAEVCLHALLGRRHIAAEIETLGSLLLPEAVEAGANGRGPAGELIDLGLGLLQLGRIRGNGLRTTWSACCFRCARL